jgi:bifunctional N-acetylglucosamine-1-phosphate-uridyltransferase/glucosamine-1-phosphate-acetyltransferase GlmU-like protein
MMSSIPRRVIGTAARRGAIAGSSGHLCPGDLVGEDARAGSFVEPKAARLVPRAKIGEETVACHTHGVAAHRTEPGAGVFGSSSSARSAPVRVGEGVLVQAGGPPARKSGAKPAGTLGEGV